MSSLVRLVYASTATAHSAHIDSDLHQIVESARQYNFNHQLTGITLYGNGYFFQCIEGKKSQVYRLYQQLLNDSRHHNITVLGYESSTQPKFTHCDWRYAQAEPQIESFFIQNKLNGFNPYLLRDQLMASFMNVLYQQAHDDTPASCQALQVLEAGQSDYVMSFKDMATVGTLLLLAIIPLYLVVTLIPGTSGFFLF